MANIVKKRSLPYTSVMKRPLEILREAYLLPTHLYRLLISPWIPRSCIYTPSCSAYMIASVRSFGIFKGTLLGLARIGRCHRLFMGGSDPLPTEFSCSALTTPYTIFRRRKKQSNH
jgi:putative membrane protein insertion efficiency factor